MCELAANGKDREWGGEGWQHACAMQTNMVPLNFFSIVAPMHRNIGVLNLLICRPEFTVSARLYEHARSRRAYFAAQLKPSRSYACSQARSALRAAKHTHRHLVGRSVYLDLKGVGRSIIQCGQIRVRDFKCVRQYAMGHVTR